jgi:hypothetical protein
MPVDVHPTEKGNIQLMHRPDNIPLAVYLTKEQIDRLEGLQRYRLFTSHFATCPSAKKWRKR